MKVLCLLLTTWVALYNAAKLKTPSQMSRPEAHSTKTKAEGTRARAQNVDCYDYTNSEGGRLHATDYMSRLRDYNFDNKIESCCFTGIWILYDNENYNSGNINAADWWAYGDNYCSNVPSGFSNKASSLRFTGAPDDWKYDTINLYFQEYFIGDEEFTYNDTSTLNYSDRFTLW